VVDDLIFRKPPLGGPPNILVFGEPAEASGAAYALGRIPLPAFMVSGAATARMPPYATAGGAISLPAFMVRGTSNYSSAVSRPLMGKVSAGWQIAKQIEGGALAKHQGAARARAYRSIAWRKSDPLASGTSVAWHDVVRASAASVLRYQAASGLQSVVRVSHQDAVRARAGGVVRWQEALRLATAPVGIRHQEAERMRRGLRARWQEAMQAERRYGAGFGAAAQLDIGRVSRCQAAMYPLPGRSAVLPPAENPCYVPSNTVVFSKQQKYSTTLIFICERHCRSMRTRGPGSGAPRCRARRCLLCRRTATAIRPSCWRWSMACPISWWPMSPRGTAALLVQRCECAARGAPRSRPALCVGAELCIRFGAHGGAAHGARHDY